MTKQGVDRQRLKEIIIEELDGLTGFDFESFKDGNPSLAKIIGRGFFKPGVKMSMAGWFCLFLGGDIKLEFGIEVDIQEVDMEDKVRGKEIVTLDDLVDYIYEVVTAEPSV